MVTDAIMTRFEEFLKIHGQECYISDYGFSPISFKNLDRIYGNWFFAVLELKERLKAFYLRGSKEKFERRVNELMNVLDCHIGNSTPKILAIGWIPSLFTIDFSNNSLADAIRIDFLKYGQFAYETGSNLIGNLYIAPRFFQINEYSHSQYLDFDFSKWIMRERKHSSRQDH